jgi:RNA polymerase sigma factor (TIGR02999 family)
MDEPSEITQLLARAYAGDARALDALARAVQADLLRHARRLIAARPGPAHRAVTLEPAELVNETFLKLLEQRAEFRNRGHFFAIATRVMLRVLLDYHRRRARGKRAGISLSLGALSTRGAPAAQADVGRVAAVLEALGRLDARAARVAELRALWGLSQAEIAVLLGVSKTTIDRDWRFARAWLAEQFSAQA